MKPIQSKLIEIIDTNMGDYFGSDKHKYIADYFIFLDSFRNDIMEAFREHTADQEEHFREIEQALRAEAVE